MISTLSAKNLEIKQRSEVRSGESFRTQPKTRYQADSVEGKVDINLREIYRLRVCSCVWTLQMRLGDGGKTHLTRNEQINEGR